MKIKKIYDYAVKENKKLLFDAQGITYPTIEGNTSNFLTDYETNHEELDRMFYIKYSGMSPIIPDDEMDDLFRDWKLSCRAILSYYLDSWARLYYALSLDYNPIWNVDGTTTRRTQGKTEGLSGTDATTMTRGARSETDSYGQTQLTDQYGQKQNTDLYGQDKNTHVEGGKGSTSTDYEVPFDSGVEKEVGKNVSSEDTFTNTDTRDTRTDTHTEGTHTDTHTNAMHSDTHTALTYTDSDSTLYGKQNNVDYTETETRSGNIGVTMTQQMLNEEMKLRMLSFWDNVYKTICKELLIWG